MRVFLGLLVFSLLAAPASAATYGWPFTVQLPMSIQMPADVAKQLDGYSVNIGCTFTPSTGTLAGKKLNMIVSPLHPPVTGVAMNGYDYNGTLTLTLRAAGGAPVSGDEISCKFLYTPHSNAPVTFKDSSPSTLTLP